MVFVVSLRTKICNYKNENIMETEHPEQGWISKTITKD